MILIAWFLSLFFDEKQTQVAEEKKWVYPPRNCFCHMHPTVWFPLHDGGEKAES